MPRRRAFSVLALLLFLCAGCAAPEAADVPEIPVPVEMQPVGEAPLSSPEPPAEVDAEPEAEPLSEPDDADFVRVADYIPDIVVELRYATEDNFTGQVIYEFTDAYLRYGTVKRLRAAQESLAAQGYGLKIWDAFRPVSAQYRLFEAYPVDAYVADPHKHYSSHNHGNTVDITLVAADGAPVEMPTDFDDFTARADRDYGDCTDAVREHAELLQAAMAAQGFRPYFVEWWHYADPDDYPVEHDFIPEVSP